ncbi:magnesium chelatase subunit D [Zavarzinia sp. CC-PAN008]|uniref:magnesium chelatase subunit D n=1 Tax=Zavarzinia sp. CC-PAN008 TaxID=3243332 RepID=UPI003F7493AD
MSPSAPAPRPAAADGAGGDAWTTALQAARLLALDPVGLGGAVLRCPAGAVRDAWLDALKAALPPDTPWRRIPAGIADDRLLGGVDLQATLALGAPQAQRGLLAEADGGVVILPMAERAGSALAARLAHVLDRRDVALEREGLALRLPARLCLIALDEGLDDSDPPLAPALAERLALHLDLRAIAAADLVPAYDQAPTPGAAVDEEQLLHGLVATAALFGIHSARAPLLALRAARAAARLAGRPAVADADAALAVRLVLAPRALTLPAAEESAAPAEVPPPPDQTGETEASPSGAPLEDVLCAAARTALPADLLAALQAGRPVRGMRPPQDGSGSHAASLRRGRPAGVRPGRLRAGARLSLSDTLRAAAPWQAQRRAGPASPAIVLRPDDIRLRRFVQRRASSIVFCVDASGSAAFDRLAEAKGAVELLLAEAYARRTFAALVVFRGQQAATVLPPTRSLSRARALLGDQAGGGGTPLAAGVEAAAGLALAERARGRTPLLVVLTDGRANVGLKGPAPRAQAMAEVEAAARQAAAHDLPAIVVDTASRPRGEGAALAGWLAARYVALPRLEATAVRDAVRHAIA